MQFQKIRVGAILRAQRPAGRAAPAGTPALPPSAARCRERSRDAELADALRAAKEQRMRQTSLAQQCPQASDGSRMTDDFMPSDFHHM